MKWTKSTYSSNDGPECVEVATTPGTIHIRDSKDTTVPHLKASRATWNDFLAQVNRR